jgi:hypothetical protein
MFVTRDAPPCLQVCAALTSLSWPGRCLGGAPAAFILKCEMWGVRCEDWEKWSWTGGGRVRGYERQQQSNLLAIPVTFVFRLGVGCDWTSGLWPICDISVISVMLSFQFCECKFCRHSDSQCDISVHHMAISPVHSTPLWHLQTGTGIYPNTGRYGSLNYPFRISLVHNHYRTLTRSVWSWSPTP